MSQPGSLVQPQQQTVTCLTWEGSEEEHSKGFLSVIFLLQDQHLEYSLGSDVEKAGALGPQNTPH